MDISNRLKEIAKHISEGSFFADIGSDHALLPCYVCLNDSTARAIAGEVQEGPFLRAIENVTHFNMNHQIEVKLGNGLQVIDEQVQVTIIAGMGGKLIAKILEQDKEKLITVKQLILQPNNHAEIVREKLIELNFHLYEEIIMEENNHIYQILIADKTHLNPYDENSHQFEKQLLFGPFLLQNKSLTFKKFWTEEQRNITNIIHNIQQSKSNQQANLNYFENKLSLIEEVLTE